MRRGAAAFSAVLVLTTAAAGCTTNERLSGRPVPYFRLDRQTDRPTG